MFRKLSQGQPGLEVRDPEEQQPGLEPDNETTSFTPRAASPAPAFTADAKHSPGNMQQQDYDHNQSYYAPAPANFGHPQDEKETKGRTILGLRPVTFFLTLALILVIILAAAIGGGVGGTVAHNKSNDNDKSKSSPTPPSTTTSVPAPVDSNVPSSSSTATAIYGLTSCPLSDSKLQHAGLTNTYRIYCDTYFLAGGGGVTNIATGMTATFDDCLGFCDSFGRDGNINSTINSIVYNVGGSGNPAGMCWCTHYDDVTPTPNSNFDIAVLASQAVH